MERRIKETSIAEITNLIGTMNKLAVFFAFLASALMVIFPLS
jgi:hypothetical protein